MQAQWVEKYQNVKRKQGRPKKLYTAEWITRSIKGRQRKIKRREELIKTKNRKRELITTQEDIPKEKKMTEKD